jgi:hypothetical protein
MVSEIVPFSEQECKGQIIYMPDNKIQIEGYITSQLKESQIFYSAAAPCDLRASFTGSALPFPSLAFGLDNTPNIGKVDLGAFNKFSFTILTPNSYYGGLGTVIVPPTVYIEYILQSGERKIIGIQVRDSIPFRSLTYPGKRASALFYDVKSPVRSQEQILRDSEYPADVYTSPSTFWGLKPPM